MKLRNFANKLLLVALLVVLAIVNCSASFVPSNLTLVPADDNTALTKSYVYDQYNINYPSLPDETIYQALGVKDFNEYLMEISASHPLEEVVVAVVDTGLDASLPVFADRVLTEYGMDFSEGLPRKTWIGGYLNNNWNVDENGHGTHVAGVIADITLPNVKILPIKLIKGSSTNNEAFGRAVSYLCALKEGKQLNLGAGYTYNDDRKQLNIVAVNLSLGSERGYQVGDRDDMDKYQRDKPSFQTAIDNLLNQGILPIVAAGNREVSTERDGKPYYSLPGSCEGSLTVSWYDNQSNYYALARDSYYNEYVSLAAPGTNIWSACSSYIIENAQFRSTKDSQGNPYIDKSGCRYYCYYNTVNEQADGERTKQWYVMEVEQDGQTQYFLRSSGTSMATPFVTACYAMLVSDSSKVEAEDYGLTSWNPNDKSQHGDGQFLTMAQKALCAAAMTYGANAGEGYTQEFGYGTIDVGAFATDNVISMGHALDNIDYATPNNTTKESAIPYDKLFDDDESVDWFTVCMVILVGAFLVWLVNMFRAHFNSYTRRGGTDGE